MEFHHYVTTTGMSGWDTVPKSRYHISKIHTSYGIYELDWDLYRDFGRAYWKVGGDFATLEDAQQYVIDNLKRKPDPPEEPKQESSTDIDELVDRLMTDSDFYDSTVGFF